MKNNPLGILTISVRKKTLDEVRDIIAASSLFYVLLLLGVLSVVSFLYFYLNGFSLAYNDARSHLDIGRRVVEGLKPGLAQLGSVWLPLPHVLMIPTVWNDFMWHSGLAGSIQSIAAYIVTGLLIFHFLRKLGTGFLGSLTGLLVFALNPNVLYLQSTAMTELLLLSTMTLGIYELMLWHKDEDILRLIKSAFWIMLSSLIRYDGWFLCAVAALLIIIQTWRKKGWRTAQGMLIFFSVLAGFGIVMWFIWNLLIFKDPLYFILGPYSARMQQQQLEQAGVLLTKGNLLYSLKIYFYALIYNVNAFIFLLSCIGAALFWLDKKIAPSLRFASIALLSPLVFNVLALYLGHSVLFIQGLSGNTWFNVRYGVMMLPSFALFTGYLIHKLQPLKYTLLGLILFVSVFSLVNLDAVTLDDALFGSSGKNVTEVSGWLKKNAKAKEGFVLISAASHDAIIFSSGMPMKRFIHEGTGLYWENAVSNPAKWARWIIMRTHDENDLTFKSVKKTAYLQKYELVDSFPFADIYELKKEYVDLVITEPILGRLK